ncbi:MAG: putative bifunctional diguanylate cyclase/phosphodiesterase [Gammaproteobacteria bacterium]
MDIASNLLRDNVKILKSEVSKTAFQGVLIAVGAIVIATVLVCLYETGEISLKGISNAQRNNFALWVMDSIPFVFGIWGQYSSSIIAYQAGAMIFDQTQELRFKSENLEKLANYASTHDTLTDLPNRALFYDRVERAIYFADKKNWLLPIFIIEIENFKEIYDTLGRINSDIILKQTASRLRGVNHERDNLARIDGNIFGILLDNVIDISEIEEFAKTIQKVMEQPFAIERLQLNVHSNIGIAHFPQHGADVDSLVQRAGVALKNAHHSSKGYAVYEPSFDKHSTHKLTLMSELRNAIESNSLELYYQGKVAIQTGMIYGAEALLRWNHPIHGFIAPNEFVEMAERTRMIRNLTRWVLKQAFRDCAFWHKQGIDMKISVNLSPKDLHDPELPDLIAGVAAAVGIRADWIILEITEGAVMHDPESAMEIINRLRKMGYHFSIDDFGTGYSSLAYLRKLPLAELKIDKSFVTDIIKNENDSAIVKSTISLAHNLGLIVTAEGVEDQETMELLKQYGCDVVQGYHLSKPLCIKDFNQWLNDSEWKLEKGSIGQ